MNGHAPAAQRSRLADLPEYVSPVHPSEVAGKPARKAKPTAAAIGRFKTMNEFVDQSAHTVDPTAQAVWLVLFREVKPNGVAVVAHSRIAERVGVSRRTVIRAVQQLEAAGLIEVVKRGGLIGGASSYRVHGTPKLNPEGVTPMARPTCDTDGTGGVTNTTSHA